MAYFPSYEIMMDDLRDYRFYTADMLHPSPTVPSSPFLPAPFHTQQSTSGTHCPICIKYGPGSPPRGSSFELNKIVWELNCIEQHLCAILSEDRTKVLLCRIVGRAKGLLGMWSYLMP